MIARIQRRTILLTKVSVSTGTFGPCTIHADKIRTLEDHCTHTTIYSDSDYVCSVLESPETILNLLHNEQDIYNSDKLNRALKSIRQKQTQRQMNYKQFLENKTSKVITSGFVPNWLNKHLFEFQRYIVLRALAAGKFAIFADCGLGKTLMQLAWAEAVVNHTNKPVLILCPLAVAGQTLQEANKFDVWAERYIDNPEVGIYITNYEQLDKIDCSKFGGVVLDESSILKNFEGKTKELIVSSFADTPYKLACTATPSPNDPMELGNHSDFLNVMSRNEMLAMYFVHDGGQTSKWRIKGHCEEKFYEWVSQWSVMLSNPADIGYESQGYNLPELNIIERQVAASRRNNGMLFNDIAVSATDFNNELRITKIERLSQVVDIVNNSQENFIVWIKQNEESEYLLKHIPGSVEVKGSDSPEYKERMLLGFANNEFRVLITKSKIAQFGMNYQNCCNQIVASLDFSFEALYQMIRRSYRFGQKHSVNIYIVTTDTMQNVIKSIKEKQLQFERMQKAMTDAVNKNLHATLKSKQMRQFKEFRTDDVLLQNGDCIQLIREIPDESIGFSIFSPPFAELYTYSDELEDMGNSKDYKEFFTAFNFLVKELFRVLWSGRNIAVHCMDLPIQKGKEGFIGLRDFSGMIRDAFEQAGFIYHSRVTIWKDPVVEMQRTKALGLLHKQVKKDSAMSRVGIPDYLLVFRKPGIHTHPVKCGISVDTWQKYASPIWQFDELDNELEMIIPLLSQDEWEKLPEKLRLKYACPVWMDVNYTNTLNSKGSREEKDEKHIAPLQLDTIERAIHLWSNEGDTVYTPFAGIGSEVYQAIRMKRKGIGHELKPSYYDVAVRNCQNIIHSQNQLTLFNVAS